jgi:hypothetical protein
LFPLGEQFQQEFPWYDDLHTIWRENPSYNPIGVANMSTVSGSQRAENLANLYTNCDNEDGECEREHHGDSPDINGGETKLDVDSADEDFGHFMTPDLDDKVS